MQGLPDTLRKEPRFGGKGGMIKREEMEGKIATILLGVAQQRVNGFEASRQILAYLHSQGVFIAKHGFYSDLMEPLIEEEQ